VVRTEKCARYLRYNFTEWESKEIAAELAQAVLDKKGAEAELKNFKTEVTNHITIAEGKIEANSEYIRSGYKMKNVDCEIRLDYDAGMVTVVRMDTGEEIETRLMAEDECQIPMDLQEKEESLTEKIKGPLMDEMSKGKKNVKRDEKSVEYEEKDGSTTKVEFSSGVQ